MIYYLYRSRMNCIQMEWQNPDLLGDSQKFQNPIYKDSLDPASLLYNTKRGLISDITVQVRIFFIQGYTTILNREDKMMMPSRVAGEEWPDCAPF